MSEYRNSDRQKAKIRRLRARYRKGVLIISIVVFIIAFILGILLGRQMALNSREMRVNPVSATPVPAADAPIGFDSPEAADTGDEGAGVEGEMDAAFTEDGEFAEGDEDAEFAEDGTDENAIGFETESAETGADGAVRTADGEDAEAPVVTPEPTPEPTPSPSPTPAPTPVVVAFGQSYSFTSEIDAEGGARREASADPYEVLNFSLTMKAHMKPEDFVSTYGTQYKLNGDEAGAEFEMTLHDYTGSTIVMPQKALDFALCAEGGANVNVGFQLVDAMIGGAPDVTLPTGTPKRFYKRYSYSNSTPMKYLSVKAYNEGVESTILFELDNPVPVVTDAPKVYPTIKKKDKGDAVAELQQRLIDLGYLEGKADGDFGSKTENAIKKAQAEYGMETTGVADDAFQQRLYSDEEPEPENLDGDLADDNVDYADDIVQ